MPWDAASFAHHNFGLTHEQAGHAARIANAIHAKGLSDGIAIAVANKLFQHRDDGGGIADPTQGGGIGGLQPSSQTANPMTQGMIQRYSSLPAEKLQELSGMLGNSPQGQIVQKLLQQKRAMPRPPQPTQSAAPNLQPAAQQRRGGATPERAPGGMLGVPMGDASPWWTRQEQSAASRPATGFLSGTTPGRADALHTQAPGGSYVVPADVMAGLGEGNSLAGAKVMDMIVRSGPMGIPQAQGHAGRGPPAPPRPMAAQAKGGDVQGQHHGNPTPVALSHGEYVLTPEEVMAIGGGNTPFHLKRGHRIMDAWVQLERKKQIAKLKKLPGPVGAKKAA